MENNTFDISDFIPKYPYISENNIYNPYPNENFNNSIFRKKEFYDEKLDKYEGKPSQKGDLMKHQKIISRFLSSHTVYDSLLLYHFMGTGKGCSAIGTIEKIKNENSNIKHAIVLARGNNILNNIINELVFVCTDGKYIPENFNKLPPDTQKSRINKILKDFYTFETFYRFANDIKKYSDEYIIKNFSNTIVVIDEVHNLRLKPKKKQEKDIYYQIHRFLHLIKNKKVLLLSGTPMKDRPEEIANILNLILPIDKQLPVELDFINNYLYEEDGIFQVKADKIQQLKSYFKGIISYLKPMKSDVNLKYIGETTNNLQMFKIFPDIMEKTQNDIYLDIFKKESGKRFEGYQSEEDDENEEEINKTGWFSQSRQASLFVYPNGSIGKLGFKKYIKEKKILKTGLNMKKSISYSYKLKSEFVDKIKGKNISETINNISKYSSKYATVIKQILNTENKSCFVYCSFVKGSGAILLSLLLELCGFSKASGSESTQKKRYALLTSTEGGKIKKIISRFNKKDNVYGKYIKVLIGSRVVGEGLSFFNIQQVHILTPHWNFSEIEQAIARTNRSFSHQELLKLKKDVTIDVFLHTSVPTFNKKILFENSIDFKMYLKSEQKDISMKNIERLLKESSFDCALNYNRNNQYTIDFSRDCEYRECNYKCDGVDDLIVNKNELDNSTYKLYYIEKNMDQIINQIKKLYLQNFIYTFDYISKIIPFSSYEILSSLRKIVNQNITIYNKYGFPNYLREENNSYFLVNKLGNVSKYLNVYYSQIPNLKVDLTFQYIINKQYYTKYIPYILNQLKNNIDREQNIKNLNLDIQEMLLENAIVSEIEYNNTNEFQKWIVSYYKNFIQTVNIKQEQIIISKLLKNKLRCYKNKEWNNCPPDILDIIMKETKENINRLEDNKFGYYGIITKNGKFLIRDVSSEKAKKSKSKSSRTKGQDCLTMQRKDLLYIIFKLDIKHDFNTFNKRNDYSYQEKNQIIQTNNKFKNLKLMLDKYKIKNINDSKLNNLFYIAVKGKKELCKYIKQFFVSNDLIEYQ